MDQGAAASWPARYLEDEISAVQSAMNLKIDDESSFMSEYQGTPLRPDMSDSPKATPEFIASKLNGVRRGELRRGPIRKRVHRHSRRRLVLVRLRLVSRVRRMDLRLWDMAAARLEILHAAEGNPDPASPLPGHRPRGCDPSRYHGLDGGTLLA